MKQRVESLKLSGMNKELWVGANGLSGTKNLEFRIKFDNENWGYIK